MNICFVFLYLLPTIPVLIFKFFSSSIHGKYLEEIFNIVENSKGASLRNSPPNNFYEHEQCSEWIYMAITFIRVLRNGGSKVGCLTKRLLRNS